MKQFKQILLTGIWMFAFVPALFAQSGKEHKASLKPRKVKFASAPQNPAVSQQLKNFLQLVADANATFSFPKGFKEIKAPNNEDVSFDYALEMPGKDFEIWLQVRSQKENWAAYEKTLNDKAKQQANPDSLYYEIGKAQALAFAGDNEPLERVLPPSIMERYNADAGRSFMINLPDEKITKHYRYALLITLQKFHTGTIMAVCFSNQKGPEFFRNIVGASNCIKFKP
ncbi:MULTISPECIES: hypothetical protein [unclassified Mucilaginibacter]|uniref:hypothetical protein n=1 Tax=unclassified Mucilaginibacter TaxID=2617802 RepID=UPI000A57A783|nr:MULTISPECIES: hypothetical protein [unclassified Mucilaginibacter]HEK19598.1 hypothetical protein [Bacteroidota bacterium]